MLNMNELCGRSDEAEQDKGCEPVLTKTYLCSPHDCGGRQECVPSERKPIAASRENWKLRSFKSVDVMLNIALEFGLVYGDRAARLKMALESTA